MSNIIAEGEFYSDLFVQGVLPRGRFQGGHCLDVNTDKHCTNSHELFHTFQRDPGVVEFEPWRGDQYGTGNVKLTLALGVELVLKDVYYVPQLFQNIKPKRNKVVISLEKLLADTGSTLETEEQGHWHIIKDGKLLLFGVYHPEACTSSGVRCVLGPYVLGDRAGASAQATGGDVVLGSPSEGGAMPAATPTAATVLTVNAGEQSPGVVQSSGRTPATTTPEYRLSPVFQTGERIPGRIRHLRHRFALVRQRRRGLGFWRDQHPRHRALERQQCLDR
jgi:hypothetical protein